MAFLVCRGCERHVKNEGACPFCGAPETERRLLGGPRVSGRAPRARVVAALGAAAVGVACGAVVEPGDGGVDAAKDTEPDRSVAPAYGLPIDAGPPPQDVLQPDVPIVPPYGGGFPPDAKE